MPDRLDDKNLGGLARGPQCDLSAAALTIGETHKPGLPWLRFRPIHSSRHDDKASGEPLNGSFFRPIAERVRAEVLPCVLGSLGSHRRRAGGRARGAAPPCVPGSSESRQRRAGGSRFLRISYGSCVIYPIAIGSKTGIVPNIADARFPRRNDGSARGS